MMSSSYRVPMSGEGVPQVFAFDIRPEFYRPTIAKSVVLILGGVAYIALAMIIVASQGGAFTFLALIFGVGGIWSIVRGLRCWRYAIVWSAKAVEPDVSQNSDSEFANDANASQFYRSLVYRFWRRGKQEPRILSRVDDAGLPKPRAILIGSTNWTDQCVRSVSHDLVEPEFVRARPTGAGMVKTVPELILVAIVWLLLVFLFLQLLSNGVSSQSLTNVVIGVIGVTALIAAVVFLFARRGYAVLGGAGLLAGPSRIELHGARRVHTWSASDTLMIVHRTSPRSGELTVNLFSDGADGSDGRGSFRFYGVNDPGFQTLWRMWIHPHQVRNLIEE